MNSDRAHHFVQWFNPGALNSAWHIVGWLWMYESPRKIFQNLIFFFWKDIQDLFQPIYNISLCSVLIIWSIHPDWFGILLFCIRLLSADSLWPHGLNSLGQNTGVGSFSLLQGIFPTRGSNPGLPHCRGILYHLNHKGSPREDPLEKAVAAHSSTLAWKIPWTEEHGRLQSMGSQRVRHDWVASLSLFLMREKCSGNL